ncbi:BspA family leucine-rich repeat surface protein [Limosilactobacillus mucosae]|uniref:BspA family leucine-rich repeat surface protein n=1 Tax=Limosilactobacillus mucosae TaxID=97478 RepID=A0AAJ1HSF2_LIMMU|nr:BspA family leucine-rich repeat surface protein [Limosilactobacillus mucosae]MDC2829143.1 BspA family leucine-rich repeat surface protein [Limosilactobacillus mucosae]MDC2837738.1 BspA family leucine-rich repeat surface protein [Limosilactobacillus mucosae]MDC2848692.1 BspA family leucine-rich repeat surface protein [Limosilactobacillus mucosae]MDC2853126.1 BspA family leucine-rich repeat surface protein [Limosilactobacillus mucosae]
MNKLQRLGKETETDRSCRVKMYKAGKNWLTSCQVCRYFLNRAVISAGAVAVGMTMATHIVKADTVNPSVGDNLTALSSTITHSEVSSVPAIEDNSVAVAPKATSTTPDQTADQIGMSTVSSAANSDSMANTAQTSAAQDNSKTISSNSSQSTTQSITAVQSATVLENERAAEANLVSSRLKMQTAAPVLANTNAIIETVEPSPLAVDYQALTKDWQVDAGNVTYIGKSTDLTTITVPNNYDFYQAGKIQAGESVTIAASVIHNLLKQNRQLSELIISSDGDGKLIAKDDWTAAFSGYDANYMNQYNSKIKSLDLGGLDVSQVNKMARMFSGDTNLVRITGLSHWNTANVTDMSYMFNDTAKLSTLDSIENWDVRKVLNMDYMFSQAFDNACEWPLTLNLSNWKTNKLTKINHLFYYAGITNLNISNWNLRNVTKQTRAQYLFANAGTLQKSKGNNEDVASFGFVLTMNQVNLPKPANYKLQTNDFYATRSGDIPLLVFTDLKDTNLMNVLKSELKSFNYLTGNDEPSRRHAFSLKLPDGTTKTISISRVYKNEQEEIAMIQSAIKQAAAKDGYSLTTAPTVSSLTPAQRISNTYQVSYIALPQTTHIIFEDESGNLIQSVAINGETDETVNVDVKIPTGWEIVSGTLPAQITFAGTATPDIVIKLKHTVTSTAVTTKTVSRNINITYPDKKSQTITQSVSFKRTAITDTDWQVDGTAADFAAIDLSSYQGINYSQAGYTMLIDGQTGTKIAKLTPNAETENITVTVAFKPDQHTMHVNYVNSQGNIIKSQEVIGLTGETKVVELSAPAEWLIADDTKPRTIVFGADGAQDITINIEYARVYVEPTDPKSVTDPLPDNSTKFYPAGVEYNDLNKLVTRTITIVDPKTKNSRIVTQTVHFTRRAIVDEVVGTLVGYTNWQTDNAVWDAIDTVSLYPGYTPSEKVEQKTVGVNDTDQAQTITFTANPAKQTVRFMNGSTQVGQDCVLTGNTDDVVVMPALPDGWQLATGESLPQNVQLAAVNTPIVIQIVAGLCTISTATAAGTLIPETKNQHLQKAIADDDLNRQVTQTVVIINPLDHTSATQQQIVLFTRSAVINMTNGELDHYTDWQSVGLDLFNEVTLPVFTGYTPQALDNHQQAIALTMDGDLPAVDKITANQADSIITVSYQANPVDVAVIFKDAAGSQISKATMIHGQTDETLQLTLDQASQQLKVNTGLTHAENPSTIALPDNWELDDSNDLSPVKMASGQTIALLVRHQTSDVSATDALAKEEFTRTINIFDPYQGQLAPIIQPATFHRSAIKDLVTGIVDYGNWVPAQGIFIKVTIPSVAGYTPDRQVNEEIVDPLNGKNETIDVHYQANDGNIQEIDYADQDGNLINHLNLSGKTDAVAKISYQAPNNWRIVPGQTLPGEVQFKVYNPVIKVIVEHQTKDVTGLDQELGIQTSKTVTRQITITMPTGQVREIKQSAQFQRSAVQDLVTGIISFGEWQWQAGEQVFAKVVPEAVAGYRPNYQVIDELTPTALISNSVYQVSYQPTPGQQTISYRDKNGNVVLTQIIPGVTDQIVNVPTVLPTGWELAAEQAIPATVTIKTTDTPIIIYVQHQLQDVTAENPQSTQDTVNRIINVRLPNGQVVTTTQTVNFKRTATLDLVTNLIDYGQWQADGSFAKVAIDPIAGYQATQTVVSEITPTAMANDITIDVSYIAQNATQLIQYVDQNNPDGGPISVQTIAGLVDHDVAVTPVIPTNWELAPNETIPGSVTIRPNAASIRVLIQHQHQDVSQTDPGATKKVTRTIKFNNPNGPSQTTEQTVTFTRTAVKDLVDNTVVYGAWQGNGVFEDVDVPKIAGYYASQDHIDTLQPTPDMVDQTIEITYSPKPIVTRIVQYVDENNQLVHADLVVGQVDSSKNYSLKLPEHWEFVDPDAKDGMSVSISMLEPGTIVYPIIYHIKHQLTTSTFPKYFTRHVVLHKPSGTETIDLTAEMRATLIHDDVTDTDTYENWQVVNSFDQVAAEKIAYAGYQASVKEIAASVPNENMAAETTIDVTYTANHGVQTIEYVDSQGNVISKLLIGGLVDQEVSLDTSQNGNAALPDNWQLAKGMTVPSEIKIPAEDQVISFEIEHQMQDVSATDPDAQKVVTRVINVFDPHAGLSTQKDTITLVRTAIKDLVTSHVTYGEWQNPNDQRFADFTVPQLTGYTASRDLIPAYMPNGEDTTLTYNITYSANEQAVLIVYQDDQQHVIGQTAVTGRTDQEVAIDFTEALPDGWVLANGQPDHQAVTFTGSAMAPIIVKIAHGRVLVEPDDPKTPQNRLPYTKNDFYPSSVGYNKLNRTITRAIKVVYPDGQTDLINQTVKFKRSATVDTVTKAVVYGEWQVIGNDRFDEFVPKDLLDYLPSLKLIEAVVPGPEDVDGSLTINYYNRYTTQTIEYVDADSGELIGDPQIIDGETGTMVEPTLQLPDGWGLDENQTVPSKIAMKLVDTPIKLRIRHIAVQVDFDHPVQKGELIAGTQNQHYQIDLGPDVLNRYATRTIIITDLQGKQSQITQRVHFVRSVWVDAVTGLPIIPLTSLEWQPLNTKSLWNAVSVPEIPGYQAVITDAATGQQLSAIEQVTPDALANQTIKVVYQAQTEQRTINYVDENGNVIGTQTVNGVLNATVPVKLILPSNWQLANLDQQPANVKILATDQPIEVLVAHQLVKKEPQLRQITRTINFKNPLNQNAVTTIVQTAAFKRAVYHDLVSDTDTYGAWIPLIAKWDELILPKVAGYEPSQTVSELVATPDTANIVLDIEYLPESQLQTVNYVDQNGNLIKTQNFTGTIGEPIKPGFKLPAGWRLLAGQQLPESLVIQKVNVPLTIQIEHDLVEQPAETRTVSRSIKLNLPNGKVQTQVRTVKFTRTVTRDLVTNQFIYGEWHRQGQFDQFDVPTIAGYLANLNQVPMIVPTADSADSAIEIQYEPQIETQLIQYVYANGAASQVISEQSLAGKTGEWLAFKLTVPKNWQLANTQSVPAMIQIKADADPIIILIQHKQKDVTDIADDTERIVTRTIKITYPNGQIENIVQKAVFDRSATEDEVTGQIVYGKWYGSDVFEAVVIPKIEGWQPSLSQVEQSVPNANTPDSTATITYSQAQSVFVIQYVDASGNYVESQPFWGYPGETIKPTLQLPAGWKLISANPIPNEIILQAGEQLLQVRIGHILRVIDEDDPDRHTTVTRTININLPNGQTKQIRQKVSFIRLAFEDEVTKQRSYGPWIAEDDGSGVTDRFAEIKVPTIKGWVPSQAVVAEYKPSGTAHSTIIDVNYLPEARSQMIEYVDEDNQLIRSDAIVGRTGETVAVQSSVPNGWEIVADKVPDAIVFDESADQPIRIVIKHRVIPIDAEQATELSHVDASELVSTITREIQVLMPHQDQPLLTKQQVEFKRLGEYDLVDQKFVSFGDWQAVGSTLMADYRVPEAAGYRPSVSGIGEQEATAGDADETIVINYVANQQTIFVKYADEHGQVIASDPISGQTDQTVPSALKVPAGWKLTAGQVVPDTITFTATTPDIVLQVAHATITVLPDDPKTTENLLPDNPDRHYPSGVDFADLNKTFTRSIVFKLPDGHLKTINQKVQFTRSAVVDEVTGQITYHDWQTLNYDKLASVTVPVLVGYTATMQVIPSLQVTAAMPDLTVEVEYVKSAAPDQPTTPDEPTPPDQPTSPDEPTPLDKSALPDQRAQTDNQSNRTRNVDAVKEILSAQATKSKQIKAERLPQTGGNKQERVRGWAVLGMLSMLFGGLLGGKRRNKRF